MCKLNVLFIRNQTNTQRVDHLNSNRRTSVAGSHTSAKKLSVLLPKQWWQNQRAAFFQLLYTHLSSHTLTKDTHTHTESLTVTHKPVPNQCLISCLLTTPTPSLTMATHPRAGTLSLTAERWLNSCEVRFCSRKACTCWIALDTGCMRVVKTAWTGKRRCRFLN